MARTSGHAVGEATIRTTRDDHLADLLIECGFGDDVRFDHLRGHWLWWNGVRWAPDRTRHVPDMIRDYGMKLWEAADHQSDPGEYRKMLLPIFDTGKKEAIMKSLSGREGIAMSGDEWDRDPYLVGFENGIMDLRTGVFDTRPEPTTLVSKSVRVAWDPDAKCPVFAKFVKDIMGNDADLYTYLLTLLGYSLFGLQSEQKFWMWTGRGSNGKGILARTMARVLGDYADTPSDTLYMRTRSGAAPSSAARPDLVRLQGVRFTYMSEPQGGQLNEELVKAHTGEDIILARDLYGRADHMAQFPPTHKIIFLANELPRTEDTGVSMRRRARVIRFEQDYTGKRADMTLEGRIEKEKQGILVLLVAFAQTWWNDGDVGLIEPQKVTDWSEEYISENDPLAQWIEEDCLIDRDEKTGSAVLYGDYEDWCARHGIEAKSQIAFTGALVKRFRRERVRVGSVFVGIRLKSIEKRAGDDDDD